ncbi:hypothetical protein DY218_17245 [Streptomyces triticagri]|uniref:Secreted protein n=1 Tax=Streptomyces triticagri TaxID=2293568 RepID=A0A372M4T3_9ACTN|nr:HAD domain-containing protein [Streptomyces triticagri]RFU85463.1 hypothetical protein DY218_17245 [Streptomyces triticagri]
MASAAGGGAPGFPGRPLLFLDVDGPLIPFGAAAEQLPGGHDPLFGTQSADDSANPLLARLDPALGAGLAALPCELVWATTWMDEANDSIAPLLGLPRLPVLDEPDAQAEDGPGRAAPHWKVPAMVAWAAGRPFVWVDDEIRDVDRTWVRAHHTGPSLLHRVDARLGLTAQDFAALGDWLRRL